MRNGNPSSTALIAGPELPVLEQGWSLSGQSHLQSSLETKVWSLRLTRWRERTDFHKLSLHHHTHIASLTCPPPPPHTNKTLRIVSDLDSTACIYYSFRITAFSRAAGCAAREDSENVCWTNEYTPRHHRPWPLCFTHRNLRLPEASSKLETRKPLDPVG